MLIKTTDRKELEIYEPKIICAEDPEYQLPIAIIDPRGITENDEELLHAMAQYKPRTRLKAGDLVMLTEIPMNMKRRNAAIPRFWKVRFVVTAWAYELMALSWNNGGNLGMDRAVAMMERNHGMPDQRKPVVFAHGYPHGMYPNTASWIPERVLRKAPFREPNASWRGIVEEAGSNFYGYDPDRINSSFSFSVAPDDYSAGANIGRPFEHEEATTHAACLSGLEELLWCPIVIGQKSAVRDDPERFQVSEEPEE